MNFLLRSALCVLAPALLSSCAKTDENPDRNPPTVKLSSPDGKYRTKVGVGVLLEASVENATNPAYSWTMANSEVVARTDSFTFTPTEAGDVLFTFRVEADNGVAEVQAQVTADALVIPEILLNSALIAYSGREFTIVAKTRNAANASFHWRLDGTTVSLSDTCRITPSGTGYRTLSLEARTEDGSDCRESDLLVLPASDLQPSMFFDDGLCRFGFDSREVRLSVPEGKSIALAPVTANIDRNAGFVWQVNGQVEAETGACFVFAPSVRGMHLVEVSAAGASAQVRVECLAPEGIFRRPAVEGSRAKATKVFEYVPAPGQFINFGEGSTLEAARLSVQTRFDAGENGWIASLGAFGGYFVAGFDHSVENVAGRADLKIAGNAFAGSSEPGIVMVMQDENGNGLPDDTWYELKGSEYGKPDTELRVAMTYYRPRSVGGGIPWADNTGNTGSVDYNSYHPHGSFYPAFAGERYMLCGTRLPSNMREDGIESAISYPWGYIDNFGDGSRPRDEFWLEDAVKADGSPANLKYIDFVKIHTAVVGKGSAIGELSTEAGIPEDLNPSPDNK
jgi:hypothetical protein